MKMTFAVTIFGAILVFFAVVMAVVFIPGWVWNPPQTTVAHPYEGAEARGRVIFYSNGCNYCHTQYVRYYDNGNGPVSQGGNYVFDNPMILGSERTGPDLSYIGRKRDEAWEIEHWKNPRAVSPMSIMPRFNFLSDAQLTDLAAYVNNLGDRTAAEWMILPPALYESITDPINYPVATPSTNNTPQGWPTFISSGLYDGKKLYIDNCQTCHGCAGNGLGTYGGTKIVTPADFKQQPFRNMPDDQWFWHVSEGIQGTVMPPWRESLSEQERWLAIRYVQQVFAHPRERDPDEGDPSGPYANLTNPLPQTVDTLENGKTIFIRECWVCHGDAATGEGIYREGIQPIPPDFSQHADYKDFTDSDYFWRISEGVPWTAMPVWKERYDENARWSLVYFIRVNYTQTLPRPVNNPAQVYPEVYLTQSMPVNLTGNEIDQGDQPRIVYSSPNLNMGQNTYLNLCTRCHGFTGMGDGWAGQYLDVKPADFSAEAVRGLSDGDWFARVSYGIQNSAMPIWSEWLPEYQRWNVIKYIEDTFIKNKPAQASGPTGIYPSVYEAGKVRVDFLGVTKDFYTSEGFTIDVNAGKDLYNKYCSACHGDNGQGKGPSVQSSPIAGPSPFPQTMQPNYVIWRTTEGVPGTPMPGFGFNGYGTAFLDEGQIWNIAEYVMSITGGGG